MKYNFLNDERLNNRFLTVEKDIRSESNSFYDAYLDLIETFIKKVINEENLLVNQRTAGEILSTDNFDNFAKENLLYDNVGLIKDYIRKCNKHKHEKEKTVAIDTVIAFLSEFFNLFNKYLDYKKEERLSFDATYFYQIYGQSKRENINLNRKVHKLLDELKDAYNQNKLSEESMAKMKEILDMKEDVLMNIEDQNNALLEKIDELKDIKIKSMEIKLNKTIELLLELKDSIAINKVVSKTVGYTIMGEEAFDELLSEKMGKKNG